MKAASNYRGLRPSYSELSPQSYVHVAFTQLAILQNTSKAKIQAWRGPEGSRKLRLPHFKTIGT
jgi:hypothetical protein